MEGNPGLARKIDRLAPLARCAAPRHPVAVVASGAGRGQVVQLSPPSKVLAQGGGGGSTANLGKKHIVGPLNRVAVSYF